MTACVTVRVERGAAEPVVEPVGTAAPELDTGDLVDPEVVRIVVGDTPMVVALAADPPSRSRGLMEVEDLGDLDGMLFDLGTERQVSFTMRNTLIPLDIYFFATDGSPVGMLEMVPCASEPCPSYSVDEPARYALEVPADAVTFDSEPHLDLGRTFPTDPTAG